MSQSIQVSFVIPTLNQADYLGRCIDSCLEQCVAEHEILVQDGGSSDRTIMILKDYGDRVNWESKPDNGQSDAINQAIARSSGDVIAWINSDDYYRHDTVLSRVLAVFDSDSEVEIVYGDGMLVDPQGRELRRYRSSQFDQPRRAFIARPSSPCSQPAVFFKRELFQRLSGLREDLHWTMDQEFFLRLFSAARSWRYIPEVFANQTMHDDAKSVRGIGQQISEITRVKREFLRTNQGSMSEYMLVHWGSLKLQAYRVVYQTGLVRLLWRSIPESAPAQSTANRNRQID